MTISMSLRGDVRRATRTMSKLEKRVLPQATQGALNKSLDKAHTETVREVGRIKGVRRKDLTRRAGKAGHIQKIPATRTKLISKLWVGLRSFVYKEPHRPKRGHLVRVHKSSWGGHYTKEDAPQSPHSKSFTATMPSGHSGAFVRLAGRKSKTNDKREPIVEVWQLGMDLAKQVNLQPEAERIGSSNSRKHAKTTFIKELRRQVEWRAAKLRARVG